MNEGIKSINAFEQIVATVKEKIKKSNTKKVNYKLQSTYMYFLGSREPSEWRVNGEPLDCFPTGIYIYIKWLGIAIIIIIKTKIVHRFYLPVIFDGSSIFVFLLSAYICLR